MRAPPDEKLQAALAESKWSSADLADAIGVNIKTVQRARVGHVSADVRRLLYQLVAKPPPAKPEPWACPECRSGDFARVHWTDGTVTHWYRCPCGCFWLRYDDPVDEVPVVEVDWHETRPVWTTGRAHA